MIVLFFFATLLSLADDTILITAEKYDDIPPPYSSERVSGSDWDQAGARPEIALQAVPGLSFSSSGGAGQSRSVFLRGARAEDTLVLLDGIPLNDPLSPSRSFDFGQIPAMDIESLEVKKGPQSVFYGSGAMGGVVEIHTKETLNPRIRLEGGSFGTIKARGSHLGFHGGYESVSGFSAADEAEGNSEKDGHKAWSLGGVKRFPLGDRANLKVQGLYHSSKTDTDMAGGAGGDSIGTFTRNSQLLFRAQTLRISSGGYEWRTAGSLHSLERDDNTVAPAFYRAGLWKTETSIKKQFGRHLPALGVEYGEETGRSTDLPGRKKFRGGALFGENQFNTQRWQLALGGRVDFHSEHERAETFRTGAGYWILPDIWRIKASIGSGFKAPSLYQTHSTFGTLGLRPARSLGGDLSLELTQSDWSGEITHFRNYFSELIDFDIASSRYVNTGKAKTSGFELGLLRRFGLFSLKGAFTSLRAIDKKTGQKLLRRPDLSGALEAAYKMGEFAGASARFRYVGEREDVHPVLFSRQPMPAFFTLGANLYHQIKPGWKLLVRGENLLNRHYQETSGFGSPNRSAFVALEAEL